jgi:hypothetical protein
MNEVTTTKQFDLSPQTFDQALTFSQFLADSDLVPKDFKGKQGNCLIAMQWGAELGLKPLQALQNLAIINGRPSLWGDAVIALVRGSALCEWVIESDDGNTATCKVKRRGEPEQSRTFSMDDAQAAGLKGKPGPWTQYPKRMRQMRARAFALRDVFPDVLRGLAVAEELMDTPVTKDMGMVDVVTPNQPVQPAFYEETLFNTNLPAWHKSIAGGKKTADEIIAIVESKAPLTEEQKARIKKLPEPMQEVPKNDVIVMTYAQVADALHQAQDEDQLSNAAALISAVQDEAQRNELSSIYQSTLSKFKG